MLKFLNKFEEDVKKYKFRCIYKLNQNLSFASKAFFNLFL